MQTQENITNSISPLVDTINILNDTLTMNSEYIKQIINEKINSPNNEKINQYI